MRTKKMRMVIDSETCPLDRTVKSVKPENMFAYDIGWSVVDRLGNVYLTRSYVVTEIFLNEKELMKSAYYKDKVPQYWADIKEGSRTLAKFDTIRRVFLQDVKKYNIKETYAHNMRFDLGALNNTIRWITKSENRFFFPYEMEICDTLKLAKATIGKMPSYQKFCIKNGYTTKNGNLRFTAEILYRFISKNNDFVESHTGLEDVLIEKEILRYCLAHNPNKASAVLFG